MAQLTNELLVLTTVTLVPRTNVTRGMAIQNQGPNSIWLCVGGMPVVNKSWRVQPGETCSLDIGSDVPVYALASTASQVTGAATIVMEVP